MISVQGLCRTEINKRIGRIRRMFKWAVAEELIPASVMESLRAIDGLRRGRSEARENPPVRPVDDAHVDAILPLVGAPVAAMIRLQRLTGMRPGEVVQLRPCDIDRSDDIWFYSPARHKTDYLGHEKQVVLGPQAQAVLQPFLDRPADAYCFSPQEAELVRNESRAEHRRTDRKTKVYPCELRARERRKAERFQAAETRFVRCRFVSTGDYLCGAEGP
jgi:site-specific recombinase XerD